MVVDFQRKKKLTRPIKIMGEEVETVESYRYLSVHLTNRLNWRTEQTVLSKAAQIL